jgi:trehalose 6-phosphate phosphatase
LQPDVRAQLDKFLRAVETCPTSLLMLDYDGTLAPFQTERHQAIPYPGVTRLLQEIMSLQRTKVVIISGRDVDHIPPLLQLHPVPEIWGLHGLQRRYSNGVTYTSTVDERTVSDLRDAQRWLVYQGLEQASEWKRVGVAVHWRGLDLAQIEELQGRVMMGWTTIAKATGLRLIEFDGGVEICARHSDKGAAVRALLAEAGPDAPSAYLGDDTTDECAFRAIEGRGLSVLVRPRHRKSAAQIWIQPPGDLVDFLTQWLESIQGGRDLRSKTQTEGSEAPLRTTS